MASYIGNKLGSEIKYISQTRFYKQVERTMNLNEKLENLNNYAVSLKNVNKEQILSKKWPENIKEMFDSTIQSVGGKSFVIYLQDKVWKRLDIDQDGVITVRDLVEFGSPKTFIEWTKQTLGNIRIPFIVNGESGKAEIN